jgi:hypothetical protein
VTDVSVVLTASIIVLMIISELPLDNLTLLAQIITFVVGYLLRFSANKSMITVNAYQH